MICLQLLSSPARTDLDLMRTSPVTPKNDSFCILNAKFSEWLVSADKTCIIIISTCILKDSGNA